MKKILLTVATLALTTTGAQGFDLESSFAQVDKSATQKTELCLNSQAGTTKTVHACTKAIRASIPNSEIRSQLYTQRGLLELSRSNFNKAARDFDWASEMDTENNFATIGQAYAALYNKDYTRALGLFESCADQADVRPLALYGAGIVEEVLGEIEKAKQNYRAAAELKPTWDAPQQRLQKLT